MRNTLHNALEGLIWFITLAMVIGACIMGGLIIQQSGNQFVNGGLGAILIGFFVIVFGVAVAFVFAGLAFEIMDIRRFTKHAALSLQKRR